MPTTAPFPQFEQEDYDPQAMRTLVKTLEQILSDPLKPISNFQVGHAATVNFGQTFDLLLVSYTATGAVTVNLAPVAAMVGRMICIKDSGGSAGTNNITIDPNGSETIDNASAATIGTNSGFVWLYSDGAEWHSV